MSRREKLNKRYREDEAFRERKKAQAIERYYKNKIYGPKKEGAKIREKLQKLSEPSYQFEF